MKKMFCILLVTVMIFTLAACKSNDNNSSDNSADNSSANISESQSAKDVLKEAVSESVQDTQNIDVDLTKLSSTMIYSEVYNMTNTPENYIGKTVKMNGQFSYYEDINTKNQYFACIIADAAACCSQGIEFTLAGNHTYPDDYPQLGSNITVTGTFEVYSENGTRYCRLANASLVN